MLALFVDLITYTKCKKGVSINLNLLKQIEIYVL